MFLGRARKKETQFLFECEKGGRIAISGKERFLELLNVIPKLQPPRTILDVGGNSVTARWLTRAFPGSEVTILNNSEKQLAGYAPFIRADAQDFRTQKKFDLVFAGEVIEHVYNPDGLLASCAQALRSDGILILTSPNLACIFNRIFLMLGWSPANYFASLRYLVGNPLGAKTNGNFGIVADHKSVFTWSGLLQLLRIYGFKILFTRGYSYAQNEEICTIGDCHYRIPLAGWRFFLNFFLPKHWREGMLFICQRPEGFDEAHAEAGRLSKAIWELGPETAKD